MYTCVHCVIINGNIQLKVVILNVNKIHYKIRTEISYFSRVLKYLIKNTLRRYGKS